jgi:hypothetical protein
MFISLPRHGTTITIQSERHVIVVETYTLSPRILPHLMLSSQRTSDRVIIVPTLESCSIAEAWSQDVPIQTWEGLMNHQLQGTTCVASIHQVTSTVSAMYDLMTTKLFTSMYALSGIFNPDAVYTTYANVNKVVSVFNALVSKAHMQSKELVRLQDLFAVYGYVVSTHSLFEFDIGAMLTVDASVIVSYE